MITSGTPQQQQPGQRSYRPWGSDPTAACGGRREGSEWQRSARDAGVKTPRRFAGHRNRGSNAVHCDSNQQPAYAGCYFTMVGVKENGFCKCRSHFLGKVVNYFRDSSTATATETVIPTMGLLPWDCKFQTASMYGESAQNSQIIFTA